MRSRKQKGSTHPASASAGLVLVPCSGVSCALHREQATSWEPAVGCKSPELLHGNPLGGHMVEYQQDWIIPFFRTSMVGYPTIKFFSCMLAGVSVSAPR